MYRDDTDAALARARSLRSELRVVTAEISEREKLLQPCTSREHAAQQRRLVELAELIAAQRRDAPPSPHAGLEAELTALRLRNVELELLAAGDDVMNAKLAEHEQMIAQLEAASVTDDDVGLTVPTHEEWVWTPRRSALRDGLRWWLTAGVGSLAAGVLGAATWTPSLVVSAALAMLGSAGLARRMQRERQLVRAQIDAIMVDGHRWAHATEIVLERKPHRLIVRFASTQLEFLGTSLGFAHVVEQARSAAALHGIRVVGELPKLLAEHAL